MRYGKRDELLSRQRTLFGVDMLERQVYDLSELVIRLCKIKDGVSRETLLDTVYGHRAAGWHLSYQDKQRSELELGEEEGTNGKT